MSSKKILYLGNIPTSHPKSIGGLTTIALEVYTFLKDKNLNIEQKQIRSFWKPKWQLIDYFFWIFKAPFVFRKYDIIMIFGSLDFNFTIAPIVWIWAKLLRKKIVYQISGGVFHDKFEKLDPIRKYLLKKTILKSDYFFAETKSIINYFKSLGYENMIWLPNSRPVYEGNLPEKKYSKKFVFVSRVTQNKGIDEIVEAFSKLSENYQVDLYGPLDNKFYHKDFFKKYKNIHYKGLIEPEKVRDKLTEYDFLLLPTFHPGEGYPGIIIESFSVALPVITTNWRSIPDIVKHDYNGFLIEPKNSEELLELIKSIDNSKYLRLSSNALKSFSNFDKNIVYQKFIKALK